MCTDAPVYAVLGTELSTLPVHPTVPQIFPLWGLLLLFLIVPIISEGS